VEIPPGSPVNDVISRKARSKSSIKQERVSS
jgi:hypothetical protein